MTGAFQREINTLSFTGLAAIGTPRSFSGAAPVSPHGPFSSSSTPKGRLSESGGGGSLGATQLGFGDLFSPQHARLTYHQQQEVAAAKAQRAQRRRSGLEAPVSPKRGYQSGAPIENRPAFLSNEMREVELQAEMLYRTQQVQLHGALHSPSTGGEMRRYFGNVSPNRPYELELDRWNHEARPAGQADEEVDEEEEEASGRATFEQLRCLTGEHRQSHSTGRSGGIRWTQSKGLCGVFLRRRGDSQGAMLWLPEAAPNLLIQAQADRPWELLQLAKLKKERVIVDKAPKTCYSVGLDFNVYAEAATVDRRLEFAVLREASAHLAERWLESASDLRALWEKDWRPLRQTSPFEMAQSKFHYNPNTKLADAFHGSFGEERWRWSWEEDGRGDLLVRNRFWEGDAELRLGPDNVVYQAAAGGYLSLASAAS